MSLELQNAYAVGSQLRSADNNEAREQIAAALAAGKHPVVIESPAYCPFTDAVLSFSGLTVDRVFDDEDEARRYVASVRDQWEQDGGAECDIVLYPKVPHRYDAPVAWPDDIPF